MAWSAVRTGEWVAWIEGVYWKLRGGSRIKGGGIKGWRRYQREAWYQGVVGGLVEVSRGGGGWWWWYQEENRWCQGETWYRVVVRTYRRTGLRVPHLRDEVGGPCQVDEWEPGVYASANVLLCFLIIPITKLINGRLVRHHAFPRFDRRVNAVLLS